MKRKSAKRKTSRKSKTASQIVLSGQRLVDMEVRRNMQLAITDIRRFFSGTYATDGTFTGGGDAAFMANQVLEPYLWATKEDVMARQNIRDNPFLFGRRAYVKHIHIKGAVYYRWNQQYVHGPSSATDQHDGDGMLDDNEAEEAGEHIGAGGTGPQLPAQTGTTGWFGQGEAIPDTGATRLPIRMRIQVIAVKNSLNDKELDILADLNRNLYSKRDVNTKVEVLYTKELCMSHSNGCVEIDKYIKLDRFIQRRENALPNLAEMGFAGSAEAGTIAGRSPFRLNMSRDEPHADNWRNTSRIFVLFSSEKPYTQNTNPMVDFHGYVDSLACK